MEVTFIITKVVSKLIPSYFIIDEVKSAPNNQISTNQVKNIA